VISLMEKKHHFIESQSRRQVLERHMISYEDAAVIFDHISDSILDTVEEQRVLARIFDRFAEIGGSA
jgi:hypothetical protein